MRKCRVCKIEKDEIFFSVDNRSKSGLQSECRRCRSERHQNKKKAKELFAIPEPAKFSWYKNAEVLFLIFAVSYLAYLALMELTK